MRHEDVWGSLDDRWGSGERMKRWKRYFGRGFTLAGLVLLFGVGSELPKLPSNVIAFADEAAIACDAAIREPLESDCSTTAWKTCEEALEYWLAARSDSWPTWNREDVARFLPQSFLCRAAHMAELAELAAVLADKYGSEFWEVIYEGFQDVPVQDNFWSFRVLITYTPWVDFDIYPYPRESNLVRIPRWLDTVPPGTVPVATLRTINAVLTNITDFTKIYDSWPSDLQSLDSATQQEIAERVSDFYWPPFLFQNLSFRWLELSATPWEIQGVDTQEVALCQKALVSVRTNQPGWKTEINECKASISACNDYPTHIRNYCRAIGTLADQERMWQKLPIVCSNTKPTSSPNDSCRRTARQICLHGRHARNDLDWFSRIRLTEIQDSACALSTPLTSILDESSEDTAL